MRSIPIVLQPNHTDTRTTPADPDRAELQMQTPKVHTGNLRFSRKKEIEAMKANTFNSDVRLSYALSATFN